MGMTEAYENRCKEGLRMFSPGYYGVCAIGGMLSAGATHLAITPLDVLKVNMQVIFFVASDDPLLLDGSQWFLLV